MTPPKISIIIPVLNEASEVRDLIQYVLSNCNIDNISDILFVDGGSTDGTQKELNMLSNELVTYLESPKGRAKQMNKGALKSKGSIFYFLHADTKPPKNFDTYILHAVKQNHAGCFRMVFDSKHPLLNFTQWFTRFNYKICRGGDQSLFIRKETFEKLGGFDEAYTVYEDCEFINRIYDNFNFYVIPKTVITSARKYRNLGVFRLQYYFGMLHFKKRMGASPEELFQYYQRYISA